MSDFLPLPTWLLASSHSDEINDDFSRARADVARWEVQVQVYFAPFEWLFINLLSLSLSLALVCVASSRLDPNLNLNLYQRARARLD